MGDLFIDLDAIADIASRLDLRAPNRDALETIAAEMSQHYDVNAGSRPFEAIVESATGVGKTYVLAAAIEYFSAVRGIRNFAIIAPGRTILEKTVDNFTPGHPKSLANLLSSRPVVVTAENFATPSTRAAMDDQERIKVYVFTVQALTKPQTETGRRTHKFQEGLGSAFYDYLVQLPDLIVFADEHHCYYGPSFSEAVRNLAPSALVGLTATPHPKTPEEQIIFRYPLAAAIADRHVKTPVLVGRKDDRVDATTKLLDGAMLLDRKAEAIDLYCTRNGIKPVNPVMLVIAQSIDEAEEYGAILRSTEFMSGRYANAVLVVHSDAPDQALADLAKVEQLDSPVRIIISVGMLKEGWDVKNVYVIASMRSSVSEILTEQTLGRGLRLPFGAYTGVEMLDTLEVLAHERYEELLQRAGIINKTLIDFRTRAVLRRNSQGQIVSVREQTQVTGLVGDPPQAGSAAGQHITYPERAESLPIVDTSGLFAVSAVQERASAFTAGVTALKKELRPRTGMTTIKVPRLRMQNVESHFSLADITDVDPFRRLGRALAADPERELRRTLVGARLVTGPDGIKRTELVTASAADRVVSQTRILPLAELVASVTDAVLSSPAVPARKEQRAAAKPLVQAFLQGLGEKAQEVLSLYLDRVVVRLVRLVAEEQRRFAAKPVYREVVEVLEFAPIRTGRETVSLDRAGVFSRGTGYEGWKKGLYEQAWFDSSPERDVANILDDTNEVVCWVRLHIGDLPILWSSAGNWYNPDFLVVEDSGTHWVVEVKSDKDMATTDVNAKREAAQRWANHVSIDATVGVQWRYLLVSESDVAAAKGSWHALKQLASA
jgi:type III restriction enzyme